MRRPATRREMVPDTVSLEKTPDLFF